MTEQVTTAAGFKQTSAAPTTKVLSGGVAGAVSVVVVWILNAFQLLPGHVEIPGEIASALTTMISFVVAYLVPPSERDHIAPT